MDSLQTFCFARNAKFKIDTISTSPIYLLKIFALLRVVGENSLGIECLSTESWEMSASLNYPESTISRDCPHLSC